MRFVITRNDSDVVIYKPCHYEERSDVVIHLIITHSKQHSVDCDSRFTPSQRHAICITRNDSDVVIHLIMSPNINITWIATVVSLLRNDMRFVITRNDSDVVIYFIMMPNINITWIATVVSLLRNDMKILKCHRLTQQFQCNQWG